MVEAILPGTYISVRDEGLISVGGVASGNIGIVGTASKGEVNKVTILSSFAEAKEIFGESDDWLDGLKNELTLIRGLELIYNNGGQTVYAVRTAKPGNDGAAAGKEEYEKSLELLENELINIVVLAGQSAGIKDSWAGTVLDAHVKKTTQIKRERIAVIGSDFNENEDDLEQITNHTFNSDRLIFTAPGIVVSGKKGDYQLPGAYLAAAGLIASLPVQASPTNKVLTLKGLLQSRRFSQQLVGKQFCEE